MIYTADNGPTTKSSANVIMDGLHGKDHSTTQTMKLNDEQACQHDRPSNRTTSHSTTSIKQNQSMTDVTRTVKGQPKFVDIAEGTRHTIGLTIDGKVYSWGRSSLLGQLGRDTTKSMSQQTSSSSSSSSDKEKVNENSSNNNHTTLQMEVQPPSKPGIVPLPDIVSSSSSSSSQLFRVTRVFASMGSTSDSGHSAILFEEDVGDDDDGGGTKHHQQQLWMTGCDRWQQLGLGSAKGGSTGYTWSNGGKIWHERFTHSRYVMDLIQQTEKSNNNNNTSSNKYSGTGLIRDVALGGDHTMVLSTSGNVYGFGKGGDGQLGLSAGKPFVSAPIKSPILSDPNVKAICAVGPCSVSLIQNQVHDRTKEEISNKSQQGQSVTTKMAGRCRSQTVLDGLAKCIETKKKIGLIR